MTEQNKNKGIDDFDDDAFDVDDFSDADLDEVAFDDAVSDEDYADEDFADEEWDQQESSSKKNKPKSSSKEKKGLSFNTIVIIGAVVVGAAVMFFNIQSKTSEVQSTKKSVFQSVLGIGEVMDGGIFGSKEEAPAEHSAATDTPAPEEQGFLSNPDTVNTPLTNTDEQNPPAPTPIAPVETQQTAEPLTPMPDTDALPRGPEETQSTDVVAPVPQSEPVVTAAEERPEPIPSARDILEQAISNREKKAQEAITAAEKPKDVVAPPVAEPEQEKPVVEVAPPAPVPVEVSKSAEEIPLTPVQTVVASDDNAVKALEGKIDLLLKRMDQIEDELGNVKASKQEDYKQIEESVQALKKDLTAVKDRPVPMVTQAKQTSEKPKPASVRQKPAREAEDREPYPVATATPRTPVPVITVSNQWELRAAQPGRAWVSKPGAKDMRGVTIGETLPGVGRITSILYQEGHWVVQGTQGQIRQ